MHSKGFSWGSLYSIPPENNFFFFWKNICFLQHAIVFSTKKSCWSYLNVRNEFFCCGVNQNLLCDPGWMKETVGVWSCKKLNSEKGMGLNWRWFPLKLVYRKKMSPKKYPSQIFFSQIILTSLMFFLSFLFLSLSPEKYAVLLRKNFNSNYNGLKLEKNLRELFRRKNSFLHCGVTFSHAAGRRIWNFEISPRF